MRMRSRWSAVSISRLLDAAAQQLRIFRLANDNLGFGTFLCKHPCDTLQRSASAITRYPIVKSLPREIVQDFTSGGPRMIVGICFQKLARQKVPEDDFSAQRPEIGDNHAREMAAKMAFLLASYQLRVSRTRARTWDPLIKR